MSNSNEQIFTFLLRKQKRKQNFLSEQSLFLVLQDTDQGGIIQLSLRPHYGSILYLVLSLFKQALHHESNVKQDSQATKTIFNIN